MAASPHPPLSNSNIEDDHHHHHHHHHGHSHSHTGHLLLHHHHQQQQKHVHHENSADSSTSSDSSSDNNSENPNSTALTNHLPVASIPPPSSSITPPVASAVSSPATAVPVSSSSANAAIATSIPVGISSANSAAASNMIPNSSTAIIPVNSSASNSAPIATAIPLLQFHPNQQQRLLSLHLSSSSSSPPPPPPPATVKTILALPIDATPLNVQNSAVISAIPDRHSRDDCWSEGATLTLIKAWGDRYVELNRGNLKQKHWKEVADCVNTRCSFNGAIKAPKTDVQCKNRLDTLKKKYKLEKSKILTGGGPSKWTFFEQLDDLIGTSTKKPLLKKLSPSSKLQNQSAQANSSPSSALRQIMPSSSSALPSSATGTAMSSLQRPLESDHEALMAEQKHMQIHLIQPKHEYFHSTQKLHPPSAQPANPNLNPNVSPNPNPNLNFNDNLNTNPNHGAVDTDTLSRSKEHSADMAMGEDCHDADADNNTASAAHRLKRKRFYSTTTTTSVSPQNSHNPIKILAKAIAKFGEVYERVEIAKHQQMMEMEKQRMEFTKELELQRLQLFMQTQVELAKLKHGGDNNKQSCNNNSNTEHYL